MFLLSQPRISDLPGVEAAAWPPEAAGALSGCVMVTQSLLGSFWVTFGVLLGHFWGPFGTLLKQPQSSLDHSVRLLTSGSRALRQRLGSRGRPEK